MANAPSAKKKTSPVVWIGIAALAFAAYSLMGGDESTPAASTAKKKPSTASKNSTQYTEEDTTAKFAVYTPNAVNVFNPLIKKPVKDLNPPDPTGAKGMDLKLTGGEPNWYYTGIVELDGAKQALFENSTSGESMYVAPGEAWKAARVKSIDVSTAVLVATDGTVISVPLQQYGVAPGASPATVAKNGAGPISAGGPALTGPIGTGAPGIGVRPVAGTATMTLPDGRTIQVPLDANAASDANNNQGGNRRRGRRNRNNNNSGDFNAP